MKTIFTAFFMLLCAAAFAQQKPTDLDKSPLDLSYCPQNYPILKMNGKTTEPPVARVIYSRPQKAGRQIFGGIVAYNQIWRLGANEVTEIEFFREIKINGKKITKGRYSIYAICTDTMWTLIINKETDTWGLAYSPKKDVLRVNMPVQKNDTPTEFFTMYFENVTGKANLIILWDTVKVILPFTF